MCFRQSKSFNFPQTWEQETAAYISRVNSPDRKWRDENRKVVVFTVRWGKSLHSVIFDDFCVLDIITVLRNVSSRKQNFYFPNLRQPLVLSCLENTPKMGPSLISHFVPPNFLAGTPSRLGKMRHQFVFFYYRSVTNPDRVIDTKLGKSVNSKHRDK